jgi:hypothetical protein
MIITLTIDRFEEENAVLLTENGEIIVWPKNKLPEGAVEGVILKFSILRNEEEEKEKREIAKEILNEIMDIK